MPARAWGFKSPLGHKIAAPSGAAFLLIWLHGAVLQIRRIYDPVLESDGYRVLVDRLWPRGVSKQAAALDEWAKDIAATPQLRTWFAHESSRFEEFGERYRMELDANPDLGRFQALMEQQPVLTLLYGAQDAVVNHAAVLMQYLNSAG